MFLITAYVLPPQYFGQSEGQNQSNMKIKKLIILYLLTQSYLVSAQCVVEAGPDKIVCVSAFGVKDTHRLGGNPTILQGTPPFKIQWSGTHVFAGNFLVHASQFLNDTTVANPSIQIGFNDVANNKPMKFYLKVTDANQNVGYDSVTYRFSRFAVLGIFREREINLGDSLQIYAGVGGAIPPLKYTWTPNYNISDTASGGPFVWPRQRTIYNISVKDSANCPVTFGGLYWTIYVKPTKTSDIKAKTVVKLSPNPMSEIAHLDIETTEIGEKELRIYDLLGRLIHQEKFMENSHIIGKEMRNNGFYFYQIWINQKLVVTGKVWKNK